MIIWATYNDLQPAGRLVTHENGGGLGSGNPPGNPSREVNPKNAKTWKSLPEVGKEYLYKPSWKVCFPMKCLYIVAYEMYFPTLILYI